MPSALPDKPVHFAVYGLLGALVLRALARGRWFGVGGRTALASIVLTITYGVSDEWHQSFVPGRSPDSMDLLVNSVGAAVVVGAAVIVGIAVSELPPQAEASSTTARPALSALMI